MEHKKISDVIFDMDGLIVDSEFVHMDYLLEFARKKNPEVTMDQLNPLSLIHISSRISWSLWITYVNSIRPSIRPGSVSPAAATAAG